jgi:serine phosphatase RsbU (regulator of sigma subunit)
MMKAGSAKVLNIFIHALGALVLIVMLLYFARDATMIVNWSGSGFVLSSVRVLEGDRIAFWGVDSADFMAPPYPQVGDTLLTIADSTAVHARWIAVLESPHTPGKEVLISYLRQGEAQVSLIKTRPVQRAQFYAVLVQYFIRLLIFFAFIGVGLWAFYKRPESQGVRALTLYCFAMSCLMGLTYLPMYPVMASFQVPLDLPFRVFLALWIRVFSSFWLLLTMLFPHPWKWMREKHWRSYALCFGPQIVLLLGLIPSLYGRWFEYASFATIVAQSLGGLLLLRHNHFHAENNLEKRQTKLVFWGSGIVLVLVWFMAIERTGLVRHLNTMTLLPRFVISNAIFLMMLASPLSFAYAFGKYRLLEIEGRLRRGTRYLTVMIFMLLVLFGAVYLIGQVLLDSFGVASRAPTLLIALVLALGFAPAQKNLQQQIEKIFYPERRKLRRMANDFLQSSANLTDCKSLCEDLEHRLREGLRVTTIFTVLKASRNGSYTLADGMSVPIRHEGNLTRALSQRGHPFLVDEAVASARIQFTPEELSWLTQRDVALLLPFRAHEQLQGFLAVGHKQDREDFHPEELQILAGLVDQVTLAIANLRLLEENLQKKRMEEELRMARRVQQRFLPQEIPPTPGLEVAASSTFSLEVAGDYYDVIALRDGRIAFAVGDVSGKGAGAALIMANLQAALRALCGVELPVKEIVARINEMIFASTDAEQYITFFVGIYEPRDGTFTYVNAGHNAPLLRRADGCIETLTAGGTVLGVFDDSSYRQETLVLAPQDVLLIYTDGLSEALSRSEEEFGEERIHALMREAEGVAAQEIMERLIMQVSRFRAAEIPEDDMTLLVVRVL